MFTFNSPAFRSAGPPSLARTLIGALLFCLALGVIVLGAIFGAVLLAVGLVVSAIGAFVMAVRRQLTGEDPTASAPEPPQTQPGLRRESRQSTGELRGVVIDVESVTEERD